MVKLFIDSNIYLALYKSRVNSDSLDLIQKAKEKGCLIVTKQVVDEVIRNRFKVSMELMDINELARQVANRVMEKKNTYVESSETLVKKAIEDYHAAIPIIKDFYKKISQQIAKGDDTLTTKLDTIFESCTDYSENQYNRAMRRYYLGNPPGKKQNCIGDSLNWEQILDTCPENSTLLIVSKDGDFSIKVNGKVTINPYLYWETKAKRIKVHLYTDLNAAIRALNDYMPDLLDNLPESINEEDHLIAPKSHYCEHGEYYEEMHGRFMVTFCSICGKDVHARLIDEDDL
jgi:hypothetical protein